MSNPTRSHKTSTSSNKKATTKKAGAKTAPAKKGQAVNTMAAPAKGTGKAGNTSATDAARTYFVKMFPTIPSVKDASIMVPGVSRGRILTVQGSVTRTMRTAERLGKLKK